MKPQLTLFLIRVTNHGTHTCFSVSPQSFRGYLWCLSYSSSFSFLCSIYLAAFVALLLLCMDILGSFSWILTDTHHYSQFGCAQAPGTVPISSCVFLRGAWRDLGPSLYHLLSFTNIDIFVHRKSITLLEYLDTYAVHKILSSTTLNFDLASLGTTRRYFCA